MISISVEPSRKEEELEFMKAGMRRHTESHVPFETYEDLQIVLRDDEGSFHGTALGEAGRGWLHVSVIWVHEDVRGQGYGRKLLEALEAEAIARKCRHSYLDTFSYQAKPFYESCGYTVFGELDDYPEGHSRFYMRKKLET